MTTKRDDKAPKRDKKRRNRNGCASDRIYLPAAGLLILAAVAGNATASIPAEFTWVTVIAGAVIGDLGRRLLDRAVRSAHTCGYEAARRDGERAMIAAFKAHGVQVVRIDEEGVERL
jgi:hypothetical protein